MDLATPRGADIAQQIVCSAENSSLDWRAQYGYLEDIGDGRGYTGGLVGFCSGTGDMLDVVERYAVAAPDAVLARFVPALRAVNGTDSHEGLGQQFERAWREAAAEPAFRAAQDAVVEQQYRGPAVVAAREDGLRGLGQFAYYDALVMHGPGDDPDSFGGIRAAVLRRHRPPSGGGDEADFLAAFLDERRRVMRREAAHADTSRIDTAQRRWLAAGNFDLEPPLGWEVYGDHYEIPAADAPEFSAHAPAADAEPRGGLLGRFVRRLGRAIR
jgi:chitosanase